MSPPEAVRPAREAPRRAGRATLGGLLLIVLASGLLFAAVRAATSDDPMVRGSIAPFLFGLLPLGLGLMAARVLGVLGSDPDGDSGPEGRR